MLSEKLNLYLKENEKLDLGLSEFEISSVIELLGPSIYLDDAELVSTDDPKELDVVKNFIKENLKPINEDDIVKSIDYAINLLGESNNKKYRALMYALIIRYLDL